MPANSILNYDVSVALGQEQNMENVNIAKITVHSDLREIEHLWRRLQTEAFATVFQTFDWLSSWMETLGNREAIEIAVVVGRDTDDTVHFILPFQISYSGTAYILGWLGGQHSNYQTGLFAKEWLADLSQSQFGELWRAILAALPHIDAVHFENQPAYWEGIQNPLSHLPSYQSANKSYLLTLKPDFQSLYEEKRSSSTRRSARKRDRRLAGLGPINFRQVTSEAELDNVLTTVFEQKIPHMEAIGVGDIFGPQFKSFLRHLNAPDANPETPLRCHYLTCGSRIIATVVGTVFRARYYGLILSMAEGPHKRHSPGELALRKTIETCCAEGLKEFDLSQGNAGYKQVWTDDTIQQFDTIIGYTAIGCIYAIQERLALSLKRSIKESPNLWSIAQTVRRSLLGQKHT